MNAAQDPLLEAVAPRGAGVRASESMSDSSSAEVALFTEALQLPPGRRAAFLDAACGADRALRRRVEDLLRTHEDIGDFLEEAATPVAESLRAAPSTGEKPGDRVDRYTLLHPIGEGGCGVVFLAEQEAPVRRRVALKIIKPGMDTRGVIARFEAERQALALMDHPHIAKMFDAGATASGRPFFVMELVRGVKITEYCDQQTLGIEERLRLFVQVCKAIQHAHQKGIVHRDIKPSNILVSQTLEGAPLPVVIDFGIAKATTQPPLADQSALTQFDMMVGTPAYMSPEQAAGAGTDVDTRTDIYGLGVLLYELLTGSTPFDLQEHAKAGLDEIRRLIREQEPVPPSVRLARLPAAELSVVAGHRRSDPAKWKRRVRGDLDWITLKALEKDRTRRYETANGLALDVERHLADETVLARPPSKLYRFRKTFLRNKLLFGFVAALVLILVTSLIAVASALTKEKQARRDADAALLLAGAEKAIAVTEATRSHQVTRFLEQMLEGVGPAVAQGRDTTLLHEILDQTAERIGRDLVQQPAVEVELRTVIGRLYYEIGNYDASIRMHAAAVALHERASGRQSRGVADSLNDLGSAYWKLRHLKDAEAAHQEALAIRQRLFGPLHQEVATSLNNLGNVYRRQGRLGEAEALIRQGLEIRRTVFGVDHLEVADSLRSLCIVLGDLGRRDASEATAREMLAMRRRLLGDNHPLVAAALSDLAWAAGFTGKTDEALQLETEAFGIQRDFLGNKHPDVAKSLYSLGERLRQMGRLGDSHGLLKAAVSLQEAVLGPDHPSTIDTLVSLGWTLEQEGKWAEAEETHRAALTRLRGRAGIESPGVIQEHESLTRTLLAQGKLAEAERVLAEALSPALLRQPSSVGLLSLRIDLHARRGLWSQAAADAALALEHQPENCERYSLLGALHLRLGDRAAYERLCTKFLARFQSTTQPFVADQLAKTCLLAPTPGLNLTALDAFATLAVERGAADTGALPFYQVCKALAQYRLGRHTDAVQWAQRALDGRNSGARGPAYAVLAMAHARLGDHQTARAMLALGDACATPALPDVSEITSRETWMKWLFTRISLDEAAALVQPTP